MTRAQAHVAAEGSGRGGGLKRVIEARNKRRNSPEAHDSSVST